MLEEVENDGLDKIISWVPHQSAFKIHEPKEFEQWILPRYFSQTKYRSFLRQLYLYGFDRFNVVDKSSKYFGAYFHPLFVKGKSELCLQMKRVKVKGTGLSNSQRSSKIATARGDSNGNTSSRMIHFDQTNMNTMGQYKFNSSNVPRPVSCEPDSELYQFSMTSSSFFPSSYDYSSREESDMVAAKNYYQSYGRRVSSCFDSSIPSCNTRRGSLLCEGSEVLFSGRRFFFTSQY
jgi:hypothetical protein